MKERSGMPYDVVAFETDEQALALTSQEEGIFHRMMRKAWINGSVPADIKELAGLCRERPSTLRKAWPKLSKMWVPVEGNPSRLENKKQESERAFKEKIRVQNQAAGKLSAKLRKNKIKAATGVQRVRNIRSTPLPSPSLPVPVPVLVPELSTSSVLETAEPNERTNGTKPDFQKFWGPVEGYLRKQIVDELFRKYYAGCQVLDMNHSEVKLAVPPALIQRNGNTIATARLLANAIQHSGTGLLRDRALLVVPLPGE